MGEAIAKRHSTTGEAVGVGARAGAYRTILTHFSQRYAKLPVIDDSFGVRLGCTLRGLRLLLDCTLKTCPLSAGGMQQS